MSTGWASEFIGTQNIAPHNMSLLGDASSGWAEEFGTSHRETPGEAWAGEFEAATAAGRAEGSSDSRRCD